MYFLLNLIKSYAGPVVSKIAGCVSMGLECIHGILSFNIYVLIFAAVITYIVSSRDVRATANNNIYPCEYILKNDSSVHESNSVVNENISKKPNTSKAHSRAKRLDLQHIRE